LLAPNNLFAMPKMKSIFRYSTYINLIKIQILRKNF